MFDNPITFVEICNCCVDNVVRGQKNMLSLMQTSFRLIGTPGTG